MGTRSTVYQPNYDNTIKAQPSGSAYAWAADTGALQAQFGATIGTSDAIQILTQGYQFAWRPDTVGAMDSEWNYTVLDQVNASAPGQVWRNKITYVGTTAATSDEFVVSGNQLKHSVHMVAPPTLPDGYSGTPAWLAIGGDIGTSAQDWQDIELWADGVSHLSDFSTADDLSFRRKDTGKEVYRIPHITITDDAGNTTVGQYRLVFGTDDTVTLYMLCPWDWMQAAEYPVVIDPTVITSTPYATTYQSPRQIVTLSNGWIVSVIGNGSSLTWYVSRDSGQTWATLTTDPSNSSTTVSMASSGTVVITMLNGGSVYRFDCTSVSSTVSSTLILGGGGFGDVAVDNAGNVHAAVGVIPSGSSNWYVYYCKSTDGGVTWTSECLTNTGSGSMWVVSLALSPSGVPYIAYDSTGFNTYITFQSSSAWTSVKIASNAVSPTLACDASGTLHCAFQPMSGYNNMYARSTDGGNTWSVSSLVATTNLTVANPSITVDGNGDVRIFYEDRTNSIYQISYVQYTAKSGVWGTPTTITNNTSANATVPRTLWAQFGGSSDSKVIYTDSQAGAVMYYDVAVDSPPNAPILVSQPNFDATTAQTLTWQFSDPDAGDSQSAYQLQILDTAAGTNVVDTGKVASTASSYALAANTLTNGKQYQWRVTTWDSSGEQGPWSSYSTFTCAAAPTVTLTTPSSGGSVSTSSITAQWSYSDPASNAQQSFQVQLLASDDATVLWDSGTVNGTGNQMTVQYTLANTTTYHLRVRATSSKGITSAWADNSFTTSFTPPAQAGVTVYANSGSARVEITINNPTPSGTQPTVSYNDLYRRNSGTSSWTRIATQLPPSVTYNDYATASGQAYDYKVTSYGSNGTQIDSTVVSTSGITLSTTGLWVHDVQDPEGTIINLRYYNASNQTTDGSVPQSRQWTPTATSLQFAGRNRPVIEFGEQETFSLTYAQIVMLATDEQWPVLEQLIRVNKSTLCFRDGRGTCIFGCVLGYQETDLVFGNMVDLTLQQTAYSLSV